MKIGFLGLGNMGTPMALRLIAAGHELSVWNRTERRTDPLAREGAIAAGTPAEAELGADAVITMLFDDAAHEEVLFGPNGLMDAPDARHPAYLLQHHQRGATPSGSPQSTRDAGFRFVAAPVFGRPNVAEDGLWIVAAGASRQPRTCSLDPRAALARHLGCRQRAAPGARCQAGRKLPHQRHDPLAQRGFVFAEVARDRAGSLSRSGQQRALSVAVLCGLRQSDAASAGASPAPPSLWARKICACCARQPRAATHASSLADNLADIFAEAQAGGPGQRRLGGGPIPHGAAARRRSIGSTPHLDQSVRSLVKHT